MNGPSARPEFAVVLPTYNEAPNVAPLVRRLAAALDGVDWRAVFVDDDSPDGTADAVDAEAVREPRVRCLRRRGKRGLASAVIDGVAACDAPVFAVMDADLQHDESLLKPMYETVVRGDADLVVASRYMPGGGVEAWHPARVLISRLATRLARAALGTELTDPMSGFFVGRRQPFVDAVPRMSGAGFKILLDYVTASAAPPRVRELPLRFRPRAAGQSKLDWRVGRDFLTLVWLRAFGR